MDYGSSSRPYRHYSQRSTGEPVLSLPADLSGSPSLAWSRPQNSNTTASMYFGSADLLKYGVDSQARFCYDSAGNPLGRLLEGPTTNVLGNSINFATTGTAPVWSATSMSGAGTLNQTGPDGSTSAVTLTATAANGVIQQSRSGQGTIAKVFSVWLKRISGSGVVSISADGFTFTTVTLNGTWARYKVSSSNTTIAAGIKIVTSGDSIAAFGPCVHAESGLVDPYTTTVGSGSNISIANDALVYVQPPTSASTFVVELGLRVREKATQVGASNKFVGSVSFDAFGGTMGGNIYFSGDSSATSGSMSIFDERIEYSDAVINTGIGPIPASIKMAGSIKNGKMQIYCPLFDALVYEDPGFVFTDVSDLGVSMAASQGSAYVKQFTVYPYYIDNLGALLG